MPLLDRTNYADSSGRLYTDKLLINLSLSSAQATHAA